MLITHVSTLNYFCIYCHVLDVTSLIFSLCFPAAFTAEQYQQHQEQLTLMQKQQLEQVQLQQQAGSTAVTNNPQVSLL